MTREDWLIELATRLEVLFKQHGATLPKYRVTCGFPSSGGLSAKNRTIGQCWSPEASGDGTTEIIIGITQDEPMRVAGVLAHEMVHAAVGVAAGHRGPFRKLALAIGLEAPMTATTEGEAFKQAVQPMLDAIGNYPHAKLDATKRRKQSTRMIKASCTACGYTVRTTAKWIGIATPTCPDVDCYDYGNPMMIG
jgi:hypothetical protein